MVGTPPQVVENDKKKIKDVIDELDHKKNQALQVSFNNRWLRRSTEAVLFFALLE